MSPPSRVFCGGVAFRLIARRSRRAAPAKSVDRANRARRLRHLDNLPQRQVESALVVFREDIKLALRRGAVALANFVRQPD